MESVESSEKVRLQGLRGPEKAIMSGSFSRFLLDTLLCVEFRGVFGEEMEFDGFPVFSHLFHTIGCRGLNLLKMAGRQSQSNPGNRNTPQYSVGGQCQEPGKRSRASWPFSRRCCKENRMLIFSRLIGRTKMLSAANFVHFSWPAFRVTCTHPSTSSLYGQGRPRAQGRRAGRVGSVQFPGEPSCLWN